jgi:hypothetical protein
MPTDTRRAAKVGAVAAATCAATYAIGFGLFAAVMLPAGYGDLSAPASQHVAFAREHAALLHAFYLVVYVLGGLALGALALALPAVSDDGRGMAMRSARALGVVWAAFLVAAGMLVNAGTHVALGFGPGEPLAEVAWMVGHIAVAGIGGGNEIVGGLWVLVVSLAARRSGWLPPGACRLGVLAGAAGMVTAVPALAAAGAVFGLAMLGWFVWVGLALGLRAYAPTTTA